MEIEEKNINIHKNENLQEWYLTEINKKGQVPLLTSPELAEPITESLEITLHVAQSYPSLLPQQHKATILKLLDELHSIQLASLSGPARQIKQEDEDRINMTIETLLLGDDISPKYSYNSTLRYALKTSAVEKARAQVIQLFSHIQDHMAESSGWIFCGPSATALDAHCVVFITRIMEAENGDSVPTKLQDYAKWATSENEWQSVMDGKPTLWTVYSRDVLVPADAQKKKVKEQ